MLLRRPVRSLGLLDTHEVDEAALRVRAHEVDADPVAHVESLLAPLDAALHRWVEDANPRTLRRRAGDDTVELLSDPAAQEAGLRSRGGA